MTVASDPPALEVPAAIRGTFKRMLYRAPREIRDDQDFQRKLLTFLKMGNESLARQFIAVHKIQLIDQLSLIKKHARDVVSPEEDPEPGEGAADSIVSSDPDPGDTENSAQADPLESDD